MPRLEVVIWDVQHGSAAYVKTPGSKHIAIDLGTGSYGSGQEFSPLRYLKNVFKIERLDEVIITHPHRDHIDDIMTMDEWMPLTLNYPMHLTAQEIIHANWREYQTPEYRAKVDKYIEITDSCHVTASPKNDPQLPENNGGATIQLFSPYRCSDMNDQSLVVVIEYAGKKIIIPGDNEPPSWRELLEDGRFVNAIKGADILVASHHGRESGYCADIFEYFSPRLTIVSDGRFCDTSATARYSAVSTGMNVYDRRREGTINRKCVTTRNDGVIWIGVEWYGSLAVHIG